MHAAGPVRNQEEVVLNVYDLSPGWNAWGGPMGLGIYHSGLQVFGTEYTFSNDGVMNHQPRETGDPNCTFRVGVVLGKLQGMTRRDVEQIVYSLKSGNFVPGTYSLVHQNCNHFSNRLACALLGDNGKAPGWVNRVSAIGGCVSCLLPKALVGDGVPTRATTGRPSRARAAPDRFRGGGQVLGRVADSTVPRTSTNPAVATMDPSDGELSEAERRRQRKVRERVKMMQAAREAREARLRNQQQQ